MFKHTCHLVAGIVPSRSHLWDNQLEAQQERPEDWPELNNYATAACLQHDGLLYMMVVFIAVYNQMNKHSTKPGNSRDFTRVSQRRQEQIFCEICVSDLHVKGLQITHCSWILLAACHTFAKPVVPRQQH